MRLTRLRRQLLVIGAILVVAIASGGLATAAGVFDNTVQASAYDLMIGVAGDAPRNQVTIVAIDEDTIEGYGRWPLPRRAYADTVKALASYRPTVIAFDVGFYDPSDRPEDDAALAAEIKAAGNVILAMQGSGSQLVVDGALRFEVTQLPIPALREAAAGMAAANILPELDGRVRRANLVITSGGERYYALPLVAAAKQLRGDLAGLRVEPGRLILPTQGFGDRVMPVDSVNDLRIYFVAEPAKHLQDQKREGSYPCKNPLEMCVISLADIAEGRIAAEVLQPLIQNRIVLIGAHSAAALTDDYPVPNSEQDRMFGVEIWANAIQTILTGRFPLLREETLPTVFWLALVTIAGVVLITRFRRVGLFMAFGVLLAYALVSLLLFVLALQSPGVVRAPSVAYVAFFGAPWWIVVMGYLQVEGQAAVGRTQRAFGLAVTPEVAKHILEMQDTGQLTPGGELREATVLFGDVRGFTSLSEGMGPGELLSTLNRYFDGMVKVVEKWGGTVNKYNGDNIMVIWGAPIPIPDHAKRAVQCALELQQFVVGERARGGPNVAFGFGINTGELVAGFLGAQGRFEYTVIGDTVNVASRLTSSDIAKRDNVAVSEGTLEALVPDVDYIDLGLVQVKGRAEAVHCFQVNRVGTIMAPNPAKPPRKPRQAPVLAG
jgi:adenylate cyclase